jgi:hypothetical protein
VIFGGPLSHGRKLQLESRKPVIEPVQKRVKVLLVDMPNEKFERGLVPVFEPGHIRVIHPCVSEVGEDFGYIVKKVAVSCVVSEFGLVVV